MEEPRLGSDANRLEGEEWFRLLPAYLFTQTVEYTSGYFILPGERKANLHRGWTNGLKVVIKAS